MKTRSILFLCIFSAFSLHLVMRHLMLSITWLNLTLRSSLQNQFTVKKKPPTFLPGVVYREG